jgi:hypothetical protein
MRNEKAKEADSPQGSNVFVPSPWLKLSQARVYLQMDNNELRKLVKSGAIRSVVRGKTTYVRTTWLDEYMESLPSGARVPAVLQAC